MKWLERMLRPKDDPTLNSLRAVTARVWELAEDAKVIAANFDQCEAARRQLFFDYCDSRKRVDELTVGRDTLAASVESLMLTRDRLEEELAAEKRSNNSLRGTITRMKKGPK